MNVNLTPKPINFKFGEYINKGFELLKKDFGGVFVGFLVTFLMSIIPFCGILAMGNFYKYLRKLKNNLRCALVVATLTIRQFLMTNS